MKKKILLYFLFISSITTAQIAPGKYLINFSDKKNSPYSLSDPSAYLSERAIERRLRYGIAIEENDLPVNPSYVDSVLSTGVTLVNKSKWFNSITISTTDSAAVLKIQSFSFVSGVDWVSELKRKKDTESINESKRKKEVTDFSERINTNNTNDNYGSSLNQIAMINGDCMHELGYMGEGMVIAVMDAGFPNVNFLPVFDSLRINKQILGTWDFVSGDSLVFDDDPHGMMTLSVMAGYLPGQLIGTAPKANYWLLRTEDNSSEYLIEEYNWVSAAEFADSVGADIINSSLGYDTFDDPAQNHTYADMNGNTTPISIATNIAASKGLLPVCSAGNSGGSSFWPHIGTPADADSALTVGAVDWNGAYASFSSTGPTSNGRIKPNIVAQGKGITVAALHGGIQSSNGTSFSSPIIAGMAACLWQANLLASNMEIINAIQESATQSSDPSYTLGYGIPNFCIANLILLGVNPGDYSNESLVNISPNPFYNSFEFTFYSTTTQVLRIELFDIMGRRVLLDNKYIKENSYNTYYSKGLDMLGSGIYILNITSQTEIYTRKLFKD